MAANSHEYQMELTDDLHVFYERTGLINYYKELESLGFYRDSYTGGLQWVNGWRFA